MSIINLLPDDYILRRLQKRANVVCLALFAVVMAGVVGAALVSDRTLSRTRQVLRQVNSDYEEAAKLLAQLQELDSQRRAMLAKAKTTDALQERVPRSYLLGLVANSLAEGMSVLDLQVQVKQVIARKAAPGPKYGNAGVKPDDVPPSTVEIEVKGIAGNDVEVARFIATLAGNQLIASVDLVYSQEKVVETVALREFHVKAELKPGVDVINVDQGEKLRQGKELAQAQGGGL